MFRRACAHPEAAPGRSLMFTIVMFCLRRVFSCSCGREDLDGTRGRGRRDIGRRRTVRAAESRPRPAVRLLRRRRGSLPPAASCPPARSQEARVQRPRVVRTTTMSLHLRLERPEYSSTSAGQRRHGYMVGSRPAVRSIDDRGSQSARHLSRAEQAGGGVRRQRQVLARDRAAAGPD